MVGVAGKSKACINCKRRRVKCGYERPTCLRCSRAHITCEGYSQQTFFINSTLSEPSVSAAAVLAKDSSSRLQRTTAAMNCDSVSRDLEELVALTNTLIASPRPFRNKAFQFIQKLYLPQPEVAGEGPSHADPTTWFGAVCELEDPSPVLDHALVAFCTIQVHAAYKSVPRDQAIERYNVALEHLSTALSQGEQTKLDYALAAIVVLSTCEIFCFPTDDGLKVHIQGVEDILRMKKGIIDISSTIWVRLWSRLRIISTISQLAGGPRYTVSVAKWAEFLPEKQSPDQIDQLMVMLYGLPEHLQSVTDGFLRSPVAGSDFTSSINALWSIVRNIYAWQAILHTANSTPAFTYHSSIAYNISDEGHNAKLFPLSLQFDSLQTATHFVISWAFQLHIHIVLQRALDMLGESAVVPQEFVNLYHTFGNILKEASKLARLICQSIEYCHRLQMGTFGPQNMVYPLWLVRQFFVRYGTEREMRWCDHVKNMKGEGLRFGIELLAFSGSIDLTSNYGYN